MTAHFNTVKFAALVIAIMGIYSLLNLNPTNAWAQEASCKTDADCKKGSTCESSVCLTKWQKIVDKAISIAETMKGKCGTTINVVAEAKGEFKVQVKDDVSDLSLILTAFDEQIGVVKGNADMCVEQMETLITELKKLREMEPSSSNPLPDLGVGFLIQPSFSVQELDGQQGWATPMAARVTWMPHFIPHGILAASLDLGMTPISATHNRALKSPSTSWAFYGALSLEIGYMFELEKLNIRPYATGGPTLTGDQLGGQAGVGGEFYFSEKGGSDKNWSVFIEWKWARMTHDQNSGTRFGTPMPKQKFDSMAFAVGFKYYWDLQ